jgi:hypothetical protein
MQTMQSKTETRVLTPDQSHRTDAQYPPYVSLLAALAIVGQVALNASAWLLPAVSEYRLIGDNMSELVLGRYGAIQTAAFLIAGVGTLGLAFVIRKLTAGLWGSRVGSLLIAVYGAGAILVAIFPTDRVDSPADVWSQSTAGMIHVSVAIVSFLCGIAGMFVLTRTFMTAARWRSLTPWLMLFPAGALALFIVQSEGPLVGLLQRALVLVISAWLIVVAFKIRSIAASGASSDEYDEQATGRHV